MQSFVCDYCGLEDVTGNCSECEAFMNQKQSKECDCCKCSLSERELEEYHVCDYCDRAICEKCKETGISAYTLYHCNGCKETYCYYHGGCEDYPCKMRGYPCDCS